MEEKKDTEKPQQEEKNKPDTCYAWLVAVMCSLIFLISGGIYCTGGIFLPELLAAFPDTDSASATFVISLMMALKNLTAIFAGCFCELYGLRIVCLAGSFLISLGLLASACVTIFSPLYITYGTIIGIGCGLQFLPCVIIMQRYFPKQHALATSILITAQALGVLIFAILIRWLLDLYAWRGAFLITSSITFHAVAFSMFFVPPAKQKMTSDYEELPGSSHNWIWNVCLSNFILLFIAVQQVALTLFESIKDLKETIFCLFAIANFFKALEKGIPHVLLPIKLLLLDYSKWQVAYLVAIMGVGDCLGRLLVGIQSITIGFSTASVFSLSLLLSGVTQVVAGLIVNYHGLCICAFLLAAYIGISLASIPPALVDLMGFDRVPRTYGLVATGRGVAGLIGLPFVAAIYDYSGNINISFFVSGSFPLIGFVFMIFVHVLQQKNTPNLN